MSKYVYKVVNFEGDASELESVINKHVTKGWELHSANTQMQGGITYGLIIFKGKK